MPMNLFKNIFYKPGLPPGTLLKPRDKTVIPVTISRTSYDHQWLEEKEIDPREEITLSPDIPVHWLNCNGVGSPEILKLIGKKFNIHELTLEDIQNVHQRPKFEDHEHFLFLVIKMISYDSQSNDLDSEQVSLLLTGNTAITFQEKPGDVFDLIRERLRKARGKIRTQGADYLVYALLDAIVDNYFVVLEKMGDQMESLENEVIENPSNETMAKIHSLRRKIIFLRRSIWPLREVLNGLLRTESPHIEKNTALYIRDLYDHTIQVIETLETFRDMLSGMLDVYLSATGNRMNEIMKVLTIISTLFIPLGFLAGLYGMNFTHMPELQWCWSYPVLLLIMVSSVIGFLLWFRKNKWI